MADWADRMAPDGEAIEAMAREVVAHLRAAFAGEAAQVLLRVEELADESMLDELEADDPFDITGVYDGVPMTEKSASEPQHFPDTVWLFRQAILAEWVERGNVTLGELVRNVTIHEFAHHFGWSDDDIASIDRWWE